MNTHPDHPSLVAVAFGPVLQIGALVTLCGPLMLTGAVLPSAQAAEMVFAATPSQRVGLFVGASIWPKLICMLVGGAGAFAALLWRPVAHQRGQPARSNHVRLGQ